MSKLGSLVLCILTVSVIAGCGDGGTSVDDGGGGVDSGGDASGGGGDASTPRDASGEADAATPTDSGVSDSGGGGADARVDSGGGGADSGPRADSSTPPTCSDDLGAFCGDGLPACASGFECQIGRCAPQDRDVCGGFAGWTCPRTAGSPYTECLYYESADFGPCFTPAERDCLCRRPDPGFSCPE